MGISDGLDIMPQMAKSDDLIYGIDDPKLILRWHCYHCTCRRKKIYVSGKTPISNSTPS